MNRGSFSSVYILRGSLYLLPHRHTVAPINHTSHCGSHSIVLYRSVYLCVMLLHPYSLDTLCRHYQSPFLLIVVGSCFSSVYPIGSPYIRVCLGPPLRQYALLVGLQLCQHCGCHFSSVLFHVLFTSIIPIERGYI